MTVFITFNRIKR